MSDKELDDILEEIRRHAMERDAAESNPFSPAPPDPEKEEAPAAPVIPDFEAKEKADDTGFSFAEEEAPTIEEALEGFGVSSDAEEAEVPEVAKEPEAPEMPEEAEPAGETDIFDIINDAPAEEAAEEPAEEAAEEVLGINDDSLITRSDDEPEEEIEADEKPKSDKKRKALVYIVSIIILLAVIGVAYYFGVLAKDDPGKPTTTPPATEVMTVDKKRGALNPLTGEEGYNKEALTHRPVAVVVENEYSTESVRPQWGMNQADIVLEGESEYSTRLLMFWADYTTVPSQVGPTRSARPPFIRFSQLFDSIFIHAGLSHSKGSYTGADTVFESENVDHINLLKYSEDGTYFGRDYTRTSTVEHTGFLNGKNVEELLKKAEIRTEINTSKFTLLEFNKKAEKLSDKAATSVNFTWSDVYSAGKCPKIGKYYYVEEKGVYTTNDFDSNYGEADLEFENLIFLLDETEYVVKENYKGSGNSETYCNYSLAGGEGMILSEGTALDITWSVENNKLVLKSADGKTVKLNPGKSYIGYGSSNKGGKIVINE